jgi:hypothetical protein
MGATDPPLLLLGLWSLFSHCALPFPLRRPTNWLLHPILAVGSFMGNELFFIIFNCFLLWELDLEVCRRSMLCWCFLYFFGQALKDLLRLPRPPAVLRVDRARATDAWPCCAWRRSGIGGAAPSPPAGLTLPPAAAAAAVAAGGVVSLEQHYAAEYGMPSTHAMNSLGLPWSVVCWVARSGRFVGPTLPLRAFAAFYTVASTASRPYMGVHSPADIFVGLALGAIILGASQLWLEAFDVWLMRSPGAWAAVLAGGAALVALYPRPPGKWKSTPGDTTLVIAATTGVHLGCVLRAAGARAAGAAAPPNFGLPGASLAGVARVAVGLTLMLLTRAVLKPACMWLLQGALGPRWGNAADVESNAREGDTPARLLAGAVAGGGGGGGARPPSSPAGFREGASSSFSATAGRAGAEEGVRLRGGASARVGEDAPGSGDAPGALRIKLPLQPESSPESDGGGAAAAIAPALVLVPPDQRYDVELPTKFIVYGTMGFVASWLTNLVHAWLGIAREPFYFSI